MTERESGLLRESAILVCEVDGTRRQTLQVMLSELVEERWQVHVMQLPRSRGGQATEVFTSVDEAWSALDGVYAHWSSVGVWHVSRFGRNLYDRPATDGKPRW
ncbi:hypothetical protein [Krasilnikovia sp. MM14-A1259]|uniref:hypothetical protein n=1 Tax=Krasilnikovia sp. MM14-A1259 TaxID=3373539 RepID=UPI0038228127